MSESTANPTGENQKVTKSNPAISYIVIGASAGGLEALQIFLSKLPFLENACIVIAQHLSPKHKSMLVQLLARETKLEVKEAGHAMILQANTVYITPPNTEIRISKGKSRLQKPSFPAGPKPSVDILFESLAEEHGSHTIGVILSGTGSDGSSGLVNLKKSGAYIIVQEPETAKYDGMPLAAIQTGLVDSILAPEKMGEDIQDYLNHPEEHQIKIDHEVEESPAMKKIFDILSHRTGSDFSNYKTATIGRRLKKRMNMLHLDSIEDYLLYLKENPKESDEMFNMILIGVTSFFRDAEAFSSLEKNLKKLIKSKPSKEPIRIWIPGCSTGEEAYTIAIILSRILKEKLERYQVQIFATDIDDRAIAYARRGIYPESAVADVPEEIKSQFFLPHSKGVELTKNIRSMVLFSKHDLTKNPPFLKLDLISCRNLMIYFNAELQKQIIPIFHYALIPDAYLFLGKSESVGVFTDLFTGVDSRNKIYQRKRGGNLHPIKFSAFKAQNQKVDNYLKPKSILQKPKSLPDLVKETLFQTYEHPYVVVNEDYDIREVSGDVRLFMSLSPGSIQVNLVRMLNEELQIEVRSVLTKAIKERISVKSQIKSFNLFGENHFVRIQVKPMIYQDAADELFVVIFEKLDISSFVTKGEIQTPENLINDRIAELENELDETKEHLQNYIEEIETGNEELQSLNEELQSTNEELQSANEELETANEELQSTNEEVQIAYTELQTTHDELERKDLLIQESRALSEALLNNELQAFVLVDASYKILKFNQKAELIFKEIKDKDLKLEDSIVDYFPVDQIVDFVADFKKAISGHVFSDEKEFSNDSGEMRWFGVNYSPVTFSDGVVTGISLGFLDITQQRKQELSLQKLNQSLEVRAKELSISNSQLEQFAYVASHDLQEPLRMVSGFLTQLEKKYKDRLDDKAMEYISYAIDGSKRMRNVIMDLLEYSKVGKDLVARETFSVKSIIEEVLILQRKLIQNKNASVEMEELPVLVNYRAPFLQVFQNLINNSLKYALDGEPLKITITSEDLGTHWRFTVKDNGVGIEPENFEKVFIIFQRLPNRTDSPGTGMGLAIVKKIIENLGGEIWVESKINVGTSFHFTVKK